jgi:hypothetical protein
MVAFFLYLLAFTLVVVSGMSLLEEELVISQTYLKRKHITETRLFSLSPKDSFSFILLWGYKTFLQLVLLGRMHVSMHWWMHQIYDLRAWDKCNAPIGLRAYCLNYNSSCFQSLASILNPTTMMRFFLSTLATQSLLS